MFGCKVRSIFSSIMTRYFRILLFLIITLSLRTQGGSSSILSPIPNAKLVYRSARLISSSDAECSDYPDKSYSLCGPGCQGVIYCDKGHKVNFTACPVTRPYCNPLVGQCGKTEPSPESCPYWSRCDRSYQPDLFDCRAFTYCRTGIIYKYVCMDNSVYDSTKHICSGRAVCTSYSNKEACLGKTRKNVEYRQDKRKYVYCGEGNAPILLNCSKDSDEISKVFNPKTGQCEIVCDQEGKFTNPDDPSRKSHIECLDMNGRYENFIRICPESTVYEPTRRVCTYKSSKPTTGLRLGTPGGNICSDNKLPCGIIGYSPKEKYGTIDKNLIFCYESGIYPAYTYECNGVDFWTDVESFRQKYVPGCSVKTLTVPDGDNFKTMELICHKKRRQLWNTFKTTTVTS